MAQFDLISDIHLDYWTQNIKDWKGLGTSLYCVVAGDISRNPRLSAGFLRHLSDCYRQIMFVDGNHEHNSKYSQIEDNEEEMNELLRKIDNVTYLANSSCVIDNTAFIGTNGWWTFDFSERLGNASRLESMEAYCRKEGKTMREAIDLWTVAQDQAEFMAEVVGSMQNDHNIDEIVIITHTVPRTNIVSPIFKGSLTDWAKLGNSSMEDVLRYDYENKISTWCFGHFHEVAYDQIHEGVRYISHPRGKPADAISTVYYPKLIDTDRVTIKL